MTDLYTMEYELRCPAVDGEFTYAFRLTDVELTRMDSSLEAAVVFKINGAIDRHFQGHLSAVTLPA